MNNKEIKYELQNIISGKSGNSYDALIQTIASYLRSSSKASPVAEEKHQNKSKETEKLISFAKDKNLFIENIQQDNFISNGAEQRVYIKDTESVIKLNDAIYYASWEDYFNNLLLHNYFFADTSYKLIGFHQSNETLFAVVEQSFVIANELTELSFVKQFLNSNGFNNTKNNDYYNPDLGIILEDLHDENVLTNNGLLYFIDTVFYIQPNAFWE